MLYLFIYKFGVYGCFDACLFVMIAYCSIACVCLLGFVDCLLVCCFSCAGDCVG